MLRKAPSRPVEGGRLPATPAWRGPLPGIAHSPRLDDASPARIITPRTPAAGEQTPRGGSAAPNTGHRPLGSASLRGDGASQLRVLRSRGQVRGVVALLGPAFVAAVAYVDPGNFATNFTAGAQFGYRLAWVIAA
ncbi:MAG TPA: hypothetical protein VHZ03_58315, partial [Trebonia sp.]|nr:hypothetical protein [Trebonia sp.]